MESFLNAPKWEIAKSHSVHLVNTRFAMPVLTYHADRNVT